MAQAIKGIQSEINHTFGMEVKSNFPITNKLTTSSEYNINASCQDLDTHQVLW